MQGALDKQAIEALLGTRPVARTDHFLLHWRCKAVVASNLSTVDAPGRSRSVDIFGARALSGFATVLPKRHARRATTRNLIKRQLRELLRQREYPLMACQLLVRLRAPFDAGRFPAAASTALRATVRAELDALLAQCAATACR